MAIRRPRPRFLLIPGALGLVGLAFLLPAVTMPAARGMFALAGLSSMAVLAAAPLALGLFGLALDRVMYAVVIVLAGLGMATLTRLQAADPGLGSVVQRQLLGLCFGTIAMGGGVFFGRSLLRLCHYRYLLLCAALIFLGLTIPFGEEAGGSRAWLRLGQIHVQPSELVRPVVIFFLASYLGQHQPLLRATGPDTLPLWRRRWLLGPIFAMWLFSLGALLLQSDLGTAFLYFAAFLVLLYLASGRMSYLLGGTGLGAVGCLAAALSFSHVRARFLVWLHPMGFADGVGYQNARSLFALASGGLTGVGPGRGLPEITPAVHTDLIFSVVGEELGLAGGIIVLLLYLALVCRGLVLACRSRDRVGYLLGAGLSIAMGLQVILIVGGTTGLLPLTGVTLPLFSSGGSSLVATLFSLGVQSGIGTARGGRGIAD